MIRLTKILKSNFRVFIFIFYFYLNFSIFGQVCSRRKFQIYFGNIDNKPLLLLISWIIPTKWITLCTFYFQTQSCNSSSTLCSIYAVGRCDAGVHAAQVFFKGNMTLEKICQQEVEKVIGMAIIYNNFYIWQCLDVRQLMAFMSRTVRRVGLVVGC